MPWPKKVQSTSVELWDFFQRFYRTVNHRLFDDLIHFEVWMSSLKRVEMKPFRTGWWCSKDCFQHFLNLTDDFFTSGSFTHEAYLAAPSQCAICDDLAAIKKMAILRAAVSLLKRHLHEHFHPKSWAPVFHDLPSLVYCLPSNFRY